MQYNKSTGQDKEGLGRELVRYRTEEGLRAGVSQTTGDMEEVGCEKGQDEVLVSGWWQQRGTDGGEGLRRQKG